MASHLLDDLPSRGKLTQRSARPSFGKPPPTYVCTSESDSQKIEFDQTNVIIRALQLKKDNAKTAEKGKGKGVTNNTTALGKRTRSDGAGMSTSSQGASGSGGRALHTKASLESMSNKELTDILKGFGVSMKRKKEELIARILQHQRDGQ
mmetsp:Transcript_42945/g.101966  ORF Transcript_42945/g.101966 Transcript_42945/m.101966 type:complete len:150 (-) Transcript_42945:138-587(-)